MSKTILRNGVIMVVNDPDMKNGDILEMEDKTLVLQHYYWAGYDKCPLCKSTQTYHSMRIKEDVEKGNCIIESMVQCQRDYLNPKKAGSEIIFIKKDICLKCGNLWVAQMFIWTILKRKNKLELYFNKVKDLFKKIKEFITIDNMLNGILFFGIISLIIVISVLILKLSGLK